MKITIAGAGAMGSRFGLMLSNAGNEVVLVDAWKDHVDAINANGLVANYNGEEVVKHLPAFLQGEVDPSLSTDLIILFTKAMGLEEMLISLKEIIHEDTKVLCLLNGIGHEEVIEQFVKRENIFIGNTMWTAGMEGPGKVKLFGNGSIALKNLVEGQEEAGHEIVKVLSDANLNAEFSENILFAIYKKACVNGTMNSLCTLLSSNMADFGDTICAHDIVTKIVEEFAAVAHAENIQLPVAEIVEYIEVNCYNRETIGLHHPSMYQDLIVNNRLTEIDYINGVIAKKGAKYGIQTPYCSFLTQLVHCKEQILKAK